MVKCREVFCPSWKGKHVQGAGGQARLGRVAVALVSHSALPGSTHLGRAEERREKTTTPGDHHGVLRCGLVEVEINRKENISSEIIIDLISVDLPFINIKYL